MVGQLTYLPDAIPNLSLDSPEVAETEKSMKDAFYDMFRTMSILDETVISSKQRIEMLVRPLAIYQEVSIPSAPDVVEGIDKTTG